MIVATIDAQWEGMGEVGSARYEPALLPSCLTIRVSATVTSKLSEIGRYHYETVLQLSLLGNLGNIGSNKEIALMRMLQTGHFALWILITFYITI